MVDDIVWGGQKRGQKSPKMAIFDHFGAFRGGPKRSQKGPKRGPLDMSGEGPDMAGVATVGSRLDVVFHDVRVPSGEGEGTIKHCLMYSAIVSTFNMLL